MTLKNRLAQLEKQAAENDPPVYAIALVDEITEAMKQEQREAHARGEKYYIVDEVTNE